MADLKNTKEFQELYNVLNSIADVLDRVSKSSTKALESLNMKRSTTTVVQSYENVGKAVDELYTKLQKLGESGTFRVHIESKGLESITTELNKAIKNFHDREKKRGNSKSNYFTQLLTGGEDTKKATQESVKGANKVADKIKEAFGDKFAENLSKTISKSISEGIEQGINRGIQEASVPGNAGAQLMIKLSEQFRKAGLNSKTSAAIVEAMFGIEDTNRLKEAEIKERGKTNRYRAGQKALTDREIQNRNADIRAEEAEMIEARNDPKSEAAKRQRAKTRIVRADARTAQRVADANAEKAEEEAREAKAKADLAEKKLQKENEKEKRNEYNRQINARETLTTQQQLSQVYGEQGSKVRSLGEQMVLTAAKIREVKIQGDELNKLNWAELVNNQKKLRDYAAQWATEIYKDQMGYNKLDKTIKSTSATLKTMSSIFQTTSATLSAAGGLWSTLRTGATSFFTRMTNGFRQVFSYARNEARNVLNEAYEQRKSVEAAKIGFKSFFGEDKVEPTMTAVRQAAIESPIVDTAELADYVMQLAPVSNGNANLALNSALGIVKGLVYSGSSTSEAEYVVKNIRDVIAKGTANAIDIRQFNRALPGLEKAISQMPDLAGFLDENGKLNINEDNVGQVLKLFADLNTSEDSPLAHIEEEQLKTLDGISKKFEETKTSTIERVMDRSGVFDLVYKVLKTGSNDSLWSKLENFFVGKLVPVVEKINNVLDNLNFDEVAEKVRKYWGIIKEGIVAAKDIVINTGRDILGTTDLDSVLTRIANIIKSFIQGLGEGVAMAMKMAQGVANLVAKGDLEQLANIIAKFFVSPMGKIIQSLIGLGRDMTGMVSRAISTIEKSITSIGQTINRGILKYADKRGVQFADKYMDEDGFLDDEKLIKDITKGKSSVILANGGSTKTKGKAGSKSSKTSSSKTSSTKTSTAASMLDRFTVSGTKAVSTLANFTNKLVKGVTVGGTLASLGTMAGETIQSFELFGDASEDIGGAISDISQGISSIVTGATIGGVPGGVIGALAFLATKAIEYGKEMEEQKKNEYNDKLSELLKSSADLYKNVATKFLGEAKVEYDPGSTIGKYAEKKLNDYLSEDNIKKLQNEGKTPEEIAQMAANEAAWAIRYKDVGEAVKAYTESADFKSLGGNKIDINDDAWKAARDDLAGKLSWYRVLGDSFDYSAVSNEEIVKQFMGDVDITDERVNALIATFENADSEFKQKTTDLTDELANTKNWSAEFNNELANLTNTISDYNRQLIELATKLGIINEVDSFSSYENLYAKTSQYDQKDSGLSNQGLTHTKLLRAADEIKAQDQSTLTYDQAHAAENPALEQEAKNLEEELQALDEIRQMIASNNYTDLALLLKKIKERNKWVYDKIRKNLLNSGIDIDTIAWGGVQQPLGNTLGPIGNPALHFATGGDVNSVGVDTVPAMLQPGEFVVRKAAASRIGLNTLFALNRGDLNAAARSLGAKFNGNYNNSRNWSNVVNNNQKSQRNFIHIVNRNTSSRINGYRNLSNRIALA